MPTCIFLHISISVLEIHCLNTVLLPLMQTNLCSLFHVLTYSRTCKTTACSTLPADTRSRTNVVLVLVRRFWRLGKRQYLLTLEVSRYWPLLTRSYMCLHCYPKNYCKGVGCSSFWWKIIPKIWSCRRETTRCYFDFKAICRTNFLRAIIFSSDSENNSCRWTDWSLAHVLYINVLILKDIIYLIWFEPMLEWRRRLLCDRIYRPMEDILPWLLFF